ncbi:hypothetical protein IJT10_00885, partial [bacterium]|nr:hypothetical protein [bacterium]
IVNFLGVIFNIKYLSKIYQFQHPETLSLNNFDFVQFVNFIFNSFMQICGYTGCQSVYSLQGLKTFSSLILVTLLILVFVLTLNKFSQISFTKKYIIIFSISSLLITSFFIVSSGNSSEIRYIIPSLASMLPILAIWLSEDKTKRKELVCGTFAICLFVQSFCLYFFPVVPRYNYKAAANWLKDNHYTQGIATFWHCAPIVELSNGEIKFWVTMSCYEIIDWMSMIMNDTLQCREKLFCLPEGNIFLLITDKERACDQSGLYADNKHLVYSYQGLNIYDYSSYRDLLDNILQKNILPVMRNNNYILPKTGISSPCMPLLKGRYNLIVNCKSNGVVKGSYLRKLSRDAFFKVKNPRSVVTFVLKDGENRVPIDIEDDSTLIDINIFNDSSNPLTVESITIDK